MRTIGIACATFIVAAGCASAVSSIDPTEADRSLGLPGTERQRQRQGSAVAYEHQIRAEIYATRGDSTTAISEYRKALAADPRDSYLAARLASLYTQQGQYHKAKRLIEKVLLEDPTDEYAWLENAQLNRALGEIERAKSAARKAIRVEPREHSAAHWLATLLWEEHSNSEAEELLRRVIEADPSSADSHLLLARIALDNGQHWRAKRAMELYFDTSPSRTEVLVEMANAFESRDNPLCAVALWELAVDKNPSDTQIRTRLIGLLIELELLSRASTHLLSLPPIESGDFAGAIERACSLSAASMPYQARSLLVAHLAEQPDNIDLKIALAAVETKLDRGEHARYLLQPTDNIDQIARRRLQQAQIELETSKTEKGCAHLTQSILE